MNLRQSFFAATLLALPLVARLPTNTARQNPPSGLSVADWNGIRAEYQRHRHGAFPDGDGFVARNSGQQWLTRFDRHGFLVKPDNGGWTWGLELMGVTGVARVKTDVNRVTYSWSADLEEWYLNDTRGLEHGFTLRAPHEIRLAVRGGLRAQEAGSGVEFVDGSKTARIRYMGLKAWDVDGRVLPARMKVEGGAVTLRVDDRGARYPITIDPIAQQAYVKTSNTGGNDSFGFAVAASGDTVVVGAPLESSSATGVNGNQADNSAPQSGAAYVFVRSGVTWTQQAYLKATNTGADDRFGVSVAISGDTIVVGAYQEASAASGVNGNQADNSAMSSGAAYVFVRTGVSWTPQAYLKASNPAADDRFGLSLSASGDTIVVAAPREDSGATGINGNQLDNNAQDSGAAYVFLRSGTTWTQQAYLKASNTRISDNFGYSIAISADTVLVGAKNEGSGATGVNGNQSSADAPGSGAAYVFVRSGATWTQEAYLKASNTGADDAFGVSVAISGNTAAVGANAEDSNTIGMNGNQADNSAQQSGAAYVFVRNGVTWTPQAYVKASNTGAGDQFGTSIGLSGDTLVVGAYNEDSAATGVGGNQNDNNMLDAGGAYIYTRSGGAWAQQAYLKSSNPGLSDWFGVAVAVSGDMAVIGASGEDSAATGINGFQLDNSAIDSGAAYIFGGLDVGVTISSSPAGLLFNVSGAGCSPGTGYVAPLTLTWTPGSACSVTFTSPQTGPGNVQYNFSRWEDNSTNSTRAITAPTSMVTYQANFAPASGSQPVGVGPSSGTAGRQLFSFTSRHSGGANNIQYAQFLFSRSEINALNGCYISYDPAANVFYLLSDDLTQWYGLLGGSVNTIGNAQCTIYGAASGSSKAGTDLTTNVDISFRSGFSGLKSIYQFSGDTSGGTSGWQTMGSWSDTGDPNVVELVSFTPGSGNGTAKTFTAVTRDGDGASTIPFVQFVMNTALSGFNGCYIHYDRASNVFFLLNDAGTEFFGLVAGSGQVSNSQCTLLGTGSGGSAVGSDLTVTYNLTFSAGFAGEKKVFMQAVDNTGVIEVWHQMGTWTR